ncbi:MAG: SMI1/KNR4 family protein [Planctomycetaceae bacterium]|jgi:hypothetical protein|nr:SMI1/KNR4 family protein [Planctomycetaceae bacterium]
MLEKTNSQILFEKINSFIEKYPEYSKSFGILASEDLIQEMEENLSIRFPYEYRLFLKNWGMLYFVGGYYEYFGAMQFEDKIIQYVVDKTLLIRNGGLPDSYIVFSSDGELEYLCMDTSQENPNVQVWHCYKQCLVETIADSFFEIICKDINDRVLPYLLREYNISIPKI